MKALLALALLFPAAAKAAGGPSVCAADVAKVCRKTSPGPERWRCLHEHESKLSPACAEHLKAMRSKGAEFREACKAEIGGACLNLQGHALIECLAAQGDKLSKPCAEKVAAIQKARQAHHELISADCKDDAQKLCKGVASGDGRIAACLKSNHDKLSASCAGAMK